MLEMLLGIQLVQLIRLGLLVHQLMGLQVLLIQLLGMNRHSAWEGYWY